MIPKNLERTSPASVGIPSVLLLDLLKSLEKHEFFHGVMVLRHGKVCMEGWWKPYAPELNHALFSVSKSFTSMAAGLAQSEGKLNINDTVISYFPEYDSCIVDPVMRQVTLKHLLTMSCGTDSCSFCTRMADASDGDWLRAFFTDTLKFAPGTHFAYNSGGTYMVAAVIRKVTGLNVREYLQPRIFNQLGITPGRWEKCPFGTDMGGWGFYLKTEDIAKFSQLLLQKGRWNGEQLIPEDYVEEATSFQIDNSPKANASQDTTGYTGTTPDWELGYGYQFWRSTFGYRLDGAFGQFGLVIPELDLVFAINANSSNSQEELYPFWEFARKLQAVTGPVEPDPAVEAEIARRLAALELPVETGDLERRHETVTWNFAENHAQISKAELSFQPKTCMLRLWTRHGLEVVEAGFGFHCAGLLWIDDHMQRDIAASAAWTSDHELAIRIYSVESTSVDTFKIDLTAECRTPLSDSARGCCFRHPFLPDELIANI